MCRMRIVVFLSLRVQLSGQIFIFNREKQLCEHQEHQYGG